LRQESPKTTLISLFLTLFFVVIVLSLPEIIRCFYGFEPPTIAENQPKLGPTIYLQKAPSPEKKAFLPTLKSKQKPTAAKPNLAKSIITENPIDIVEIPKSSNTTANSTLVTFGTTETNTGEVQNIETTEHPVEVPTKTILNAYELDKNPEFPGGIKVFLNYVGKNFKTPEIELEKTVKIYVSFVVEKDGSMSDIEVKRDPGYGLGDEAIRVLKSLKTKWEPGKKDGKAVRAYYNLPITVELK
jgi:protein TonB